MCEQRSRAKSRKSFFTTLTFSIVTGYENDKFTGMLPPERNEGIYFDTEQSKYKVFESFFQAHMQAKCPIIYSVLSTQILTNATY